MKKQSAAMGLMLIGGLLTACGDQEQQADESPVKVVATTSQIGDSVSEIGGDLVEVTSLMGPGVDPHSYQATQNDINALQEADIVFYNGLHLEGKMDEIFEQISGSKPVLALGEAVEEENLLTDADNPEVVDPHIWFDVPLWKEALESATSELIELLPEDEEVLEDQKNAYFEELDSLIEESENLMGSIDEEKRVLVTAHDAFGYFGRMHDLEVIGLQGLSTEDEVGINEIQQTVNLLTEREIPSVFVESSISDRSIQAVIQGAEQSGHKVSLGGELYSDAMGEEETEEGTYIGMYLHNAKTISKALQEDGE
ncbi:zinc ABC transporter substrate-binding protein [Jeotgalibacillus sp. ET6]|uniref:metal ABC transporter solute-binding protein, Zn/Mn family n=1 Tax=Jeotgalibacillus sp. ET6 TaxID=3037260 RepID=UPI0024182128|nr:zinc ABC transporter substrate-binding protein [Jeotgalibacillus sp. ET6]MDG5470589.1 zinc ABC transporter substrate-binding protein [Jeotgalibacillus sp. ET6]